VRSVEERSAFQRVRGYSTISTRPAAPSTQTIWPSGSWVVADPVPTTAGNAVLPGDDRRMRQHTAVIGHHGRRAREDDRPAGMRARTDENFARLEARQLILAAYHAHPWNS
jgi:hypothetical protein